ncbi:MAG: nickel pincer cofactor biosynthesis protein LarB [Oscillospiraceae bacterium]|nr:nickel pincer cofactor biosynthesis protein LarB [Oscillospiraceae bacterium]
MQKNELEALLKMVADHSMTVEEAVLSMRQSPFDEIGFAAVDLHRGIRQGVSEVIYGAGKTAEQIIGIVRSMQKNGQERVLITRLDEEKAGVIQLQLPLFYQSCGKIGLIGQMPSPDCQGTILILTGGTSDIPVAEEAAFTAQVLGNPVKCIHDVGVSGLHRLLSHMDDIMRARVIIVIAGMEGALASVVGGLAACPVIAVPTSVGYGTAFGGLTALLAMLNSCASGVSVVNIDNGFGAAYQASQINHIGG